MTEVIEDLHEVKSVTLSLDAYKKDIKLFPIVVKYFLPNRGIVDKIIDKIMVFLHGETYDLHCDC